MPWRLTVRTGPRVEREHFEALADALTACEARARRLAQGSPRAAVDTRLRRFEPGDQVAARVELAGPERLLPSIRGGLDIRGDGSAQAYLGRLRREPIEPRRAEDAYAALRRALNQQAAGRA